MKFQKSLVLQSIKHEVVTLGHSLRTLELVDVMSEKISVLRMSKGMLEFQNMSNWSEDHLGKQVVVKFALHQESDKRSFLPTVILSHLHQTYITDFRNNGRQIRTEYSVVMMDDNDEGNTMILPVVPWCELNFTVDFDTFYLLTQHENQPRFGVSFS